MQHFKLYLIYLIVILLATFSSCDYYTSISGLEDLAEIEITFVAALEKYLKNFAIANEDILSFLDEVELEQKAINANPHEYYGNPINAFKIIKRLHLDWPHIEGLNNMSHVFKVYNDSISIPKDEFDAPTLEDIKGAARGLARLQDMYNLDTEDVSLGNLMDYNYSDQMSISDCFILGRSLYESGQHLYASEWLMQARKLLKLREMQEQAEQQTAEDVYFPKVTAVNILEYLAPTLYIAGNRRLAVILNEELLTLDPQNYYGLTNKKLFEERMMEERRIRMVKPLEDDAISKNKTKIKELYKQVCSGELKQTAQDLRPLRCRYVSNNVPFCRIAPFKMKVLSLEPFVAYYHQTISDNEIDKILDTAELHIERSRVGVTKGENSEYRTSKNTWLDYNENDFLAGIAQRLQDITGLSLESAEPLQVANYGIGGHYGPHYDYSDEPNYDYEGKGNRILTALFYINDVELGGSTAFPLLRLNVQPVKGSLVVWHNLHKTLGPDYRTIHAGCPVLKGSKWICNAWFHTIGQEFKRPCDLQPDNKKSLQYKHYNLNF